MLVAAVAVSIASLLVAPMIPSWTQRSPRGIHLLDAITLALVPGVVLIRLMPHLMAEGGIAPAFGLVAGYLGFQLAESRAHHAASRLGVAVVLPALAIHALFDGATLGLVLGDRTLDVEGILLVVAVVLHRAPEGLFVGCALARAQPRSIWAAVGVLAALTVLGALIGHQLVALVPAGIMQTGIAAGLGIMVRMVVDRHTPISHPAPSTRRTSLVVFVVCLALVLAIPDPHLTVEPGHSAASDHALTVIESAVAIAVSLWIAFDVLRAGPRQWLGKPLPA